TGSVVEAGGVGNGTAGTPTASGTLTDSDVDNTPNTFDADTAEPPTPRHLGSRRLPARKNWTYTLDNGNSTVESLNNGQSTTDTSTVTPVDCSAKAVTITVIGTLSLHDALPISTGSVVEAGGVGNGTAGTPTASGTLTDSDVDNTPN